MKDETVFVYVMCEEPSKGNEFAGPVKVGISARPRSRAADLSAGNARDVMVFCAFPMPNREICAAAEAAFHKVMGDCRIRREWFDLHPAAAAIMMCVNIEAMLRSFVKSEEDIQNYLDAAGVTAVREKMATVHDLATAPAEIMQSIKGGLATCAPAGTA